MLVLFVFIPCLLPSLAAGVPGPDYLQHFRMPFQVPKAVVEFAYTGWGGIASGKTTLLRAFLQVRVGQLQADEYLIVAAPNKPMVQKLVTLLGQDLEGVAPRPSQRRRAGCRRGSPRPRPSDPFDRTQPIAHQSQSRNFGADQLSGVGDS